MRPGSLVAAGCVALLAYWKLGEGAHISAVLLFVTAAGFVVIAMLPGARARSGRTFSARSSQRLGAQASVDGPAPDGARRLSADQMEEPLRAKVREARVWRLIGIGGLVISLAGVFYFPPMALVVAGLAVYAFHRMRRAAYEGQAMQAPAPQ